MKKRQTIHKIKEVVPGSIADEMELEPGDAILSVNGCEIEDVFDYHYYMNEEYLTVQVQRMAKSGNLR